ncbi:MAG: hypothetical protein ABW185_15920, partial [Sedimenticola sp.]
KSISGLDIGACSLDMEQSVHLRGLAWDYTVQACASWSFSTVRSGMAPRRTKCNTSNIVTRPRTLSVFDPWYEDV